MNGSVQKNSELLSPVRSCLISHQLLQRRKEKKEGSIRLTSEQLLERSLRFFNLMIDC